MEIIPATPAHYQGIAATYNSLHSSEKHVSALEIAEGDKRRDPKFKFQRWVAIEKDQVVGIGYLQPVNLVRPPSKIHTLDWSAARAPETRHWFCALRNDHARAANLLIPRAASHRNRGPPPKCAIFGKARLSRDHPRYSFRTGCPGL